MRFKPSSALRSSASRLALNAGGAVAPMFGVLFAFALLPLGGAAIDLSRVLSARADLQDSLDATALALGKLPQNTSQADLQAAANRWMARNVHDPNATDLKVTVKPYYADSSTTTSRLQMSATEVVKSIFTGSIGGVEFGQYAVGARSTTSWGMQRVEVAMVLDNTGSMMESDGSGGTKSETLKQAAKDLIDTLAGTATASGDKNVFKVGMVPFATYVNVGAGNKGAWITGTSPYDNDIFQTPTDRFALFTKIGQTWGGCVESRPMPYDVQDDEPSSATPATLFVPYFSPDEPDDTLPDRRELYQNNYLPDKVAAGVTDWRIKQGNVAKYTGKPTRAHPNSIFGSTADNGPNKGCPSVPLIRLTTNYDTVKSAIDDLEPAGNTHIPLGLVWGWHLLSNHAPFSDGVAYGTAGVRKVVILVTDGENTYTRGYNNGLNASGTAQETTDDSFYTAYGYVWQKRIAKNGGATDDPAEAMNDRLKTLCTNMQNAGVTLYTIPLRVTDADTKGMLQACASSADKYLEASTGDELKAKFKTIAGSISALRISK